MFRIVRFALALLFLIPMSSAWAQEAKKPLDHDVYDFWNRIQTRSLSSDGTWALYTYGPDRGDGTLKIHSLTSDVVHTFGRGSNARFTRDASHVVFVIEPAEDSVKAAKEAKKKDDEMPKDSLGILNLSSGALILVPNVRSYQTPEEAGHLVAYLVDPEPVEPDTTEDGEKVPTSDEGTLVLHRLGGEEELRLPYVKGYEFSERGRYLAAATAPPDTASSGVLLVTTESMAVDTLLTGKGDYTQMAFDEGETQFAFLSNRDDHEADDPTSKLYYWTAGVLDTLVTSDTPGIPDGWRIGDGGNVSFSESGARLFLGTQPVPEPEPEEVDEDDEVVLDIWNWKDPLLQPNQLVQLNSERNRTYRAVLHLEDRQLVQLAHKDMPTLIIGSDGDDDIGIANTNIPYRQEISWDSPRYSDVYLVDVRDGSRRLILEGLQGSASLSPGTNYVTWWDRNALAWMSMPSGGGEATNISEGVPQRLDNELHDWPYPPNSYGSAGWTEEDAQFLVYDKHDIWALDPTGAQPPTSLTDGHGREHDLRLRFIQLDDEADAIAGPMLLSALDYGTKAGGFYQDTAEGDDPPTELVMMDRSFGFPQKAEDASTLLLTRSSFEEFGDLWVTRGRFGDMRRISDVNPQQSEYRWGTAELVSWTSLDGIPLQGMLFKPDDFDASQQYPMMVYFYEKMSNGLHQHRAPSAGGSSINFSFYVSRGYLVFVPDIPYKVGYPGESALNAVVPGVTMLINQGFVQADNVGVQGHSWGGYQIAYMVTETNLFKAAEAGAPVSNMTSAYGGIRWGSGLSRMMQYERTQSRIGGSLWEYPLRYIDNSPLFQADKIETPVLMMHNDDDGAVPWYQGIEFFVALRRLGKPVWMLNYNGAGHGLSKFQNRRDWTIRMQQFFDHYLTGAPAPVWMEHGVPATMKGRTLGLELVEEE